jgi:hypothetical protein
MKENLMKIEQNQLLPRDEEEDLMIEGKLQERETEDRHL